MMKTVQRGRERQEDGEVGVLTERAERLVGAVGRGGQPVGAQADPGQERDERHLVEDAGVLHAARRTEYGAADAAQGAFGKLVAGHDAP